MNRRDRPRPVPGSECRGRCAAESRSPRVRLVAPERSGRGLDCLRAPVPPLGGPMMFRAFGRRFSLSSASGCGRSASIPRTSACRPGYPVARAVKSEPAVFVNGIHEPDPFGAIAGISSVERPWSPQDCRVADSVDPRRRGKTLEDRLPESMRNAGNRFPIGGSGGLAPVVLVSAE
ncbi:MULTISPECIES: hypothetical protein [unclassified Saccharopolyspora]|uniref:hypothetical protein n=1 Tax=unclassified Saccharopolyspora TaxID=2646250 RepID=UPI001CD1A8A1|nr:MULTISPECIES: hypothetical protein [unclassified Saccharopolyspora]MCA1188608.1 hypothetical protein [Saccharopolyspora sp. 6T]MCA1193188.1 hypothetical protein [Saccharopolyspora sp. 6V]